jgi:hypothetical protein
VPLFRRARRDAVRLPLEVPLLDGSTWPPRQTVGRVSFATSTLYQMGYREAFSPEAQDVVDLLLGELLPLVQPATPPEDAPYLRRTLTSAIQVGAGIGIVERNSVGSDEWSTDGRVWGALWLARRDLPPLRPEPLAVAAYLLLSGHFVARTHPASTGLLLDALRRGPPGA